MSLLQSFTDFITRQQLFTKADRLLLAVSGGVDSVVLCELCRQAGYDFAIAHCNFRLRGEESERDEKFVQTLGQRYKAEVWLQQFDTAAYARENKFSVEEAARKLRYTWFAALLAENKATVLVTAHHADDAVETLLMNFFRGTGLRGLHGIPVRQPQLVRPLLFARREAIEAFAREQQLTWVEDSTNAGNEYTRNYFRNELIPGLQKVFPAVKENLLQNIARFSEAAMIYQAAMDEIRKKLLVPRGREWHIPVLKLQKTRPLHTVLFEIIRDFGFTAAQTAEVAALLNSESGRYVNSATHRVLRNRKWLIIGERAAPDESVILIENMEEPVRFAGGTVTGELRDMDAGAPAPLSTSADCAQLDAAAICFPLQLRRWKAGDYFYPLGMRKKKKISRLLTDMKLSLNEKEKVWVIESARKIIWVAGIRIDDRFKITGATRRMLKLQLIRNADAESAR